MRSAREIADGQMAAFTEAEDRGGAAMSGLKVGAWVLVTGVLPEDPEPLEVGERGMVTDLLGGPLPQIHVKWDSGRALSLLPDDPFRVLEPCTVCGEPDHETAEHSSPLDAIPDEAEEW